MTKRFEERLARLENKLRARREPPPFIPVMIFDGKTVTACMAPPIGVARDLSAFYAQLEWRDRATCLDADTCPSAGYCEARGNITKRMTKEELDTLGRLLEQHEADDIDQLPDSVKAEAFAIIDAAAARTEPAPSVPSYQRAIWQDGAWVIDTTYRGVGVRED